MVDHIGRLARAWVVSFTALASSNSIAAPAEAPLAPPPVVPSAGTAEAWSPSEIVTAIGVRGGVAYVHTVTRDKKRSRVIALDVPRGCPVSSADVSLVDVISEVETLSDGSGIKSKGSQRVEATIRTPDYRAALGAYVDAIIKSGGASWPVATSANGRDLLVQAGDIVHWSTDGGASFAMFDGAASYDVRMSSRGVGITSVCPGRCGGLYVPRIVDFRGGKPASFTALSVKDVEQVAIADDGASAYAMRKVSDARACTVRIDVATHTTKDIYCGGRSEPYRSRLALSPSGAYAAISTTAGANQQASTDAIAIVALPAGRVLAIHALPVGEKLWLTPIVGDNGSVALQRIERGRITLDLIRADGQLAGSLRERVVPVGFDAAGALIYVRPVQVPSTTRPSGGATTPPACGWVGALAPSSP